MGTQETPTTRRRRAPRAPSGLLVVAAVFLSLTACAGDGAGDASWPGPWGTNTVVPADLVRELASGDKPVVVCTAPPSWYRRGHIPGAVFYGPASSPSALRELTSWARTLPRDTSLVIYCGCCPLAYCPNLEPAYDALEGMGFRRLRVLILPENFGTDWAARGYPIER